MTTAVVVQARMGSSRLPGKVLLDLAGRTVLWHVLSRCRAIPGVDVVCCAVPDLAESAPVEAEALACGAVVARGPEDDVLERYRRAAEQLGADIVMRVTSDCPLIDPQICAEVLTLREREQADYACNIMPRGWPRGLDCEVFTAAALAQAASMATAPEDREHVTPWLRRSAGVRRANLQGPGGAFADRRWTLDFAEDYQFFQAVFELLPPPPHIATTAEVDAVLARHPSIATINAVRHVPAA